MSRKPRILVYVKKDAHAPEAPNPAKVPIDYGGPSSVKSGSKRIIIEGRKGYGELFNDENGPKKARLDFSETKMLEEPDVYSGFPVFDHEFHNEVRKIPFDALLNLSSNYPLCQEVPTITVGGPAKTMSFLVDCKVPHDGLRDDGLGAYSQNKFRMKTQRFFIKDNYLSTKENCDFIITKRYYNHAGAKPRGSVIKVIWAASTVGKKRLRALISYKIAANAAVVPTSRKSVNAAYTPERDPSVEAVEAVRAIDDLEGQLDEAQKTNTMDEETSNEKQDDSMAAENTLERSGDANEVGNPYSPHFRYPMSRAEGQRRIVATPVIGPVYRRRTPQRSRSPFFLSRCEPSHPSSSSRLRSAVLPERPRIKVDGGDPSVNTFLDKAEHFFGRFEECLGSLRTDPAKSMELWDPRNKGFFSAIGGFTKNLDDEQLKAFHDDVLQYAFQCGNNLKCRPVAAPIASQENPGSQV